MPNLLRSLAVLSLCASAAFAQDNKWSDDVLCKRGKADACARAGREAIDQGQEGDEKAYARAKPLLEQGCKANAPAAEVKEEAPQEQAQAAEEIAPVAEAPAAVAADHAPAETAASAEAPAPEVASPKNMRAILSAHPV